jgi:hypothetical protein
MTPLRRTALLTGLLFAVTIVCSIPGALLYTPLLGHPAAVLASAEDTGVRLGALLEILTAAANIGTAVVLFPLLRRRHEALALGYVASRITESVLIAVGIVSVLAAASLRQSASGSDTVAAAEALIEVHAATFLLGPGLLAGVGNGLMLLRTHLVARPMALLGVIGGSLQALSGIAVLLGLYAQTSVPSGLATLPELVWEVFLAVSLTGWGFQRRGTTAGEAGSRREPAGRR